VTITKVKLYGVAAVFCLALFAMLARPGWPASGTPSTVIKRVGYLLSGFQPPKEFLDAMNQLGYIEGKNVVFEYRPLEGQEEGLPQLAGDLVRKKVDVIVAPGAAAGLAAKSVSRTIPIVYLGGGDPVALGLVASLAHPGGNVTGISDLAPGLTAKRLELLHEAFPKAASVAMLVRARAPHSDRELKDLGTQAKILGLKLRIFEVQRDDDLERSFSTIEKERLEALIELPNPFFHSNRKPIVDFALRSRMPSIFHSRDFVDAGGLMSYGAEFADMFRRAAIFVDKILKGAKPANLPIEQPTKFEFLVNLKTARQIGVTIAPNVVARADQVIR
jgi:ABC-type uncharacterized transport system substrate-binding protein